jgi:hypothetical protein
MKDHALVVSLTGLTLALAACDSRSTTTDAGSGGSPAPMGTAGAPGSGGGGGGSSGATGTAGSGGGAGSGGAGGSAGAGGTGGGMRRDASTRADSGPRTGDAPGPRDGRSDVPAGGFLPPMYPPPRTLTCAAGCAELRSQYADAVLRAQRCTVGAASPCGFQAPGSLGCGGCPVWVNDHTDLIPLANRFNQMGCYGCYFDGAAENRCHAIGCADLIDPVCTAGGSGEGTCTNVTNRPCPAGVMNGTPCTRQPDQCMRGGGFCFCSRSSPNWGCFGS